MGEGQFWVAGKAGLEVQGLWRDGSRWGFALEGHHNQDCGFDFGPPDLRCWCHYEPAVWPWGSCLLPLSFCILGVK